MSRAPGYLVAGLAAAAIGCIGGPPEGRPNPTVLGSGWDLAAPDMGARPADIGSLDVGATDPGDADGADLAARDAGSKSDATDAEADAGRRPLSRVRLTIPASGLGADVSEVAVPISLGPDPDREAAQEGANKIWFTDTAGGMLPYELVRSNRTGVLDAWVEWPTIRHDAETSVYMVIGPTEQRPLREDMWSQYAGVWHFDSGSTLLHDSSPNRNDATGTMTNSQTVEGVVDTAMNFEGANAETLEVVSSESLRVEHPTVMGWMNHERTAMEPVIGKTYESSNVWSYGFWFYQGNLNGTSRTTTGEGFDISVPAPPIGSWVHFALVLNGAEARLYLDGVRVNTAAFTDVIEYNDGRLVIGTGEGWGYQGSLDEIMIVSSARSDDWVQMSWRVQALPDLVEVGPVEVVPEF